MKHFIKEKTGSKYSAEGLFSAESLGDLDIPQNLRSTLAFNLNHTIAQDTWSAYRTGIKKLEQFSTATNSPLSLPLTKELTLAFSAWILDTGVSAATLETYLSSLRMLHLIHGKEPPKERPQLLSAALKGKKNRDNFAKRDLSTRSRLPMTPSLLKLMKLELRSSNRCLEDKRMIWTAAVVAFSGGLRGGEFLCRQAKFFDPDTALRERDMKLDNIVIDNQNVNILKLKLRSEKQNRSNAATICDIYPSASSLCPVSAFEKWQGTRQTSSPNLPAFRFKDGSNLTISAFNKILKETLGPHTRNFRGKISSHSFRIGLASMIGLLGFSDEQVMAAGRWSSRAYQAYLKLPRTRRLEMARAIGNIKH